MNNGQPTHFDGCAGFGGFSIAAEWAGFQTVGFCEIADYPIRILKQHWPDVPNYGDLRECPTGHVHLFTCGFPCPPFSIAGRRRGEADDRYLWPAVLDSIGRLDADWAVLENVVNLKNMVLSRCLDELEERGYQHATFDLPSCAVGLQSVERHLWIIASRDGKRLEGGQKAVISRKPEQGAFQCKRGAFRATDAMREGRRYLCNTRTLRSRKGIPNYVERITGIGNAVPPPVAFQILKTIHAIITSSSRTKIVSKQL